MALLRRRTYVDVNGSIRVIDLVKEDNNLVKWHIYLPESLTSLWMLEDDSIIQIPNNAWISVSGVWSAPRILHEST